MGEFINKYGDSIAIYGYPLTAMLLFVVAGWYDKRKAVK